MPTSEQRHGVRTPSDMCRSSIASFAAAARIAGMLIRNVNRAAASRRSPSAMPVTIVAPERDTPGTSAIACAAPIASAPAAESDSSPFGARHVNRSMIEEHACAQQQRDGRHARRPQAPLRPHPCKPRPRPQWAACPSAISRTRRSAGPGDAAKRPRQRRDHLPDVVAEKQPARPPASRRDRPRRTPGRTTARRPSRKTRDRG